MRSWTMILLGAVALGGCQSRETSQAPAPAAKSEAGQPVGAAIETLGIT